LDARQTELLLVLAGRRVVEGGGVVGEPGSPNGLFSRLRDAFSGR
jgi:hypothetical protein